VAGSIRQSSAEAYLFPLDQRPPTLTVLAETTVQQIVLDDHGAAVGVISSRGELRADKEVILCAGAFDSPKLLMLSGIGPAEHLRRVGVPVRHDLPGVGEHLQDHIEALAMWQANKPVPSASTQRWENGLFARVLSDGPEFDLMMHFGSEPYYIDFAALGYPIEMPAQAFCLTPNVARPASAGVVRLRSADPTVPPLIDPRYFTDAEGYDERLLVEGIRLARRIAEHEPLRGWMAREVAPGPALQSDAELGEYVRRTSNTVYHPAGSCRMGAANDGDAVVDPALRVRGLERLRVADASVFPTMIGVNLCMTVMMIGEKCADMVRSGEARAD
jgi:choline oxidase